MYTSRSKHNISNLRRYIQFQISKLPKTVYTYIEKHGFSQTMKTIKHNFLQSDSKILLQLQKYLNAAELKTMNTQTMA